MTNKATYSYNIIENGGKAYGQKDCRTASAYLTELHSKGATVEADEGAVIEEIGCMELGDIVEVGTCVASTCGIPV